MTEARPVFISYSTRDTEAALAVREGLESHGIQCWMAPRDITPGTSWAAAIDKAIQDNELMVLILSSHSNSSPQVVREVCNAVNVGVTIIPFQIEETVLTEAMKYFLSTVHWFDAKTPPLEDHINRLIKNAGQLLSKTAAPEVTAPPQVVLPKWTQTDANLSGREAEMARLGSLWAEAHAGSARAALVSGETGTGKTRLAQDFVTLQAGAGARWLAARSIEGDQSFPYAALEGAIKPVVEQGVIPDLPPEELAEVAYFLPELGRRRPGLPKPRHLEPEQARVWRRRAWANYLVGLAKQAPVIFHLDDLQWIDPATLDCFRYLLIQHPDTPIFVIASLRTDHGKPGVHIREFRTDLHRSGVLTEISLGPLSEAQFHELLRGMSGMTSLDRLSRRLYRQTEGNVFFLLELIQALFDQGILFRDEHGSWATQFDDFTQDYSELPLPESISDLMEPRLEGLDDRARGFLDAAAVVGREFDPFLVQELCGLDRRELRGVLDDLVTRGLIRTERRTCQFAHGLLRETVYEQLNFLDRFELHENVGLALERAAGSTPSPTEIQQLAHHFYQAELWEPAFQYQLEAGLKAWSSFETHAARRYLETAHEIATERLDSGLSPEQELSLLTRLGDVYANLGPHEQALDCYRRALQLVPSDPARAADLCWRMAVVYERQPDHQKAAEWLNQGLAAIGEEQDGDIRSRLYLQLGLISIKQGRLEEAFEWATKALVVESAQAHNLLAVLHRTQGELETALQHCSRAIELAESSGDLINLSKACTNRGVVLVELDRWEEAVRDYEHALELLVDTGDAYVHALTLGNLADVLRHLGELEAAWNYARTALVEAQTLDSEFDIALAHLNLGEILLEQGEPGRARREHLEPGLEYLLKHEILDLKSQAERDIARAFLQEGRLAEAEEAAQRALAAAGEPASPSELGIARRILGRIYHAQGRGDEGQAALAQSRELLSEHGPRYELARTHLAQAEALAEQPEQLAEARQALENAAEIFQELGAARDLARVAALRAHLAAE